MTKKMLEDMIKNEKKKSKKLIIVIIILSILLFGALIFAFSEFEVSTEEQNTYELYQEIDSADGNNNNIEQCNNICDKDNTAFIIIFVICASSAIIYGAIKIWQNINKK